jgi:hypothetical protein
VRRFFPGALDGGTFRVQQGGPYRKNEPIVVPALVMAIEHYGRIARLLEQKKDVEIEVEPLLLPAWRRSGSSRLSARGRDARSGSRSGARFRGLRHAALTRPAHDQARAREVVGIFPRRQRDREDPGHLRQENAAVVPIFEKWLEPLKDLGATTVTMRNTRGTDHESFDAVGLPASQFIQDGIEYETRTHHTNQHICERLQREDLMQPSVVLATFVWQASMRDAKLPRKPMPKENPNPSPTPTPAAVAGNREASSRR